MKKGILDITLRYAGDLFFLLFATLFIITDVFAIVDALIGTEINASITPALEIGMRLCFPVVLVICVIQWSVDLINLIKSFRNNEEPRTLDRVG